MEKEAAVNRASFSVGEKGVPMQLQKLLSLVRQAVDRYNMIAEGDKIAVGSVRREGQSDASLCTEEVIAVLSKAFYGLCDLCGSWL